MQENSLKSNFYLHIPSLMLSYLFPKADSEEWLLFEEHNASRLKSQEVFATVFTQLVTSGSDRSGGAMKVNG